MSQPLSSCLFICTQLQFGTLKKICGIYLFGNLPKVGRVLVNAGERLREALVGLEVYLAPHYW